MPFLLGLLAIIGAAAFWYFRMRNMAHAASELKDHADTLIGKVKYYKSRKKYGKQAIDIVDDPMVAAGGILTALVRMQRIPTPADEKLVAAICKTSFEISKEEATEIAAYGTYLSQQTPEPSDIILKLVSVINDNIPLEKRGVLPKMMQQVCESIGGATDEQEAAYHRVKSRLGV